MPKSPKKTFDERGQYIDDELARLEKAISGVQKELLDIILVDYVTLFTTDLVMDQATLQKLFELTPIFEQLAGLSNDLERKVAGNLLKLTEYSESYFSELGLKVTGIKKQIGTLYEAIGITEKGAIIEEGYLSKLFGTINGEFQQGIKDYVLESIGGNKSYTDFVKGFKQIIVGNKEVDGKLLRYYKTYANDLYSKVARLSDNYYASELDLKYFVYDGTIIDTTRPFCEQRVGKVFTREQAEDWQSLTFAGKSSPYSPLIDLGGYNCRHLARWITDEYGLELLAGQEGEKQLTQKDWENSLLEEDKKLIKRYTNKDYSDINAFSRGLIKEEFLPFSDLVKEDINKLSSILDNAPKTKGITYRGVSFTDKDKFNNLLNEYKKGNIITDKGFMSTTLDKSVIKKSDFWNNDAFKIQYEINGKNGVYIENLSAKKNEMEILFNKNSTHKITEIKEINDRLFEIKLTEL